MTHTMPMDTLRAGALAAMILCMSAPADAQLAGPVEDPVETRAMETANPAVFRAAQAHRGTKILVSTKERRLRLVVAKDTVMDIPVGIGKGVDFEYQGRKFRFETPTGRRRVLAKAESPLWTVPEWHYMEKASHRGLELVRLKDGDEIELGDGSHLVVRDGEVGRVNHFGNFWAFRPGTEIVFDGRIFMPPLKSNQRRVPDALGPYKLELGDGYLLHGTNPFNENTVGGAVSHGCIRLTNDALDRLYHLVDVGTPVFIY